MEFWKVLLIIVIALVVLIFVLFPEARALFSGLARVFIKDMATTPEGARAIYGEKIEQAQESYNKADNALKVAAGRLSNAKSDMEKLKARRVKVESECEALVKAGKMDMAQLKSDERDEIMADIERYTELIKAYQEAEIAAKDAHAMCEKRLRKLKKESKEVVENMRVKEQLKEVYDDMDELKNMTGTDKMLESVREKNRDLNEFVEGARVVHDNRISTKLQRAEAEARKTSSNDYLESLKKKYNK